MKNQIHREMRYALTGDGSFTLYSPIFDEPYHSLHGAVTESLHIYIANGLEQMDSQKPISILEIGLGTGLNAYLTALKRPEQEIHYTALEPYPLSFSLSQQLTYPEFLQADTALFSTIHSTPLEESAKLNSFFTLEKREKRVEDWQAERLYDLIYFDAFAPCSQPELWTEEVFTKMYACMCAGAVLMTYSAKGAVRRAMQAVGFRVERLPGPPGKREILRAVKV